MEVRLDVPADPLLVHDKRPIRLDIPPLDEHGRRIPHLSVQVVGTSDPNIVAIDPLDGLPRCQSWGDATLALRAESTSAEIQVRCQIVGEIRPLSPDIRLVRGEETLVEQQVQWETFSEAGQRVPNIPLRMSVADPNVAQVGREQRIRGHTTGITTLHLGISGISLDVPVIVGEVTGRVDLHLGGNLDLPAGDLDLYLIGNTHPIRLDLRGPGTCQGALRLEPGAPTRCTFEEHQRLNLVPALGASGHIISVRWPVPGEIPPGHVDGGARQTPLPGAHTERGRVVEQGFGLH